MSEKFTPEWIAEQREIIQSATDGKWMVGKKPEIDGDEDYAGHWVGGFTGNDVYDRDMGVYCVAAHDHDNETDYEPETICQPDFEDDAEHIAEAHNNYPDALTEIEKLQADLTAARADLSTCQDANIDLLNENHAHKQYEAQLIGLLKKCYQVVFLYANANPVWWHPETNKMQDPSGAHELLDELVRAFESYAEAARTRE